MLLLLYISMLKYLVLVGVVVQLAGVFSYMRDTLRGKTKPNKVTWFMWSIAPLIATAAALLVFISSFFNPKAYWKLEKFDYVCGIFSLLALILWGITQEPIVAIIFAMASDGIAAIPTLVKAWSYPDTETSTPYTTGMFNALTGFAAIPVWTFNQYAFPIYLVFINATLLFTIYRKRIFK